MVDPQALDEPLRDELVRDARRVDDVVAVCRARARLERGRQIEVADPEVAQVRDELLDLPEAEPGPELEAIRRPEAHAGEPTRGSGMYLTPGRGPARRVRGDKRLAGAERDARRSRVGSGS